MYHEYTQDELRAYCRTCIETFEIWARRFIHEIMEEKYDSDYLYAKLPNGDFIISRTVRNQVERMMDKEPTRFHRKIDTLFVEHIVDILCTEKLYKELFCHALLKMYPQGKEAVRTYLSRVAVIRNYLSHANPISIRQAEQAICYSHDFIDGIKQYYKDRGGEQVWNIPRIVKIKDSMGNVFDNPKDTNVSSSIFEVNADFHCGDTYSVEIEIDSSFSKNDYEIIWKNCRGTRVVEYDNSERYTITFDENDIAHHNVISCYIVQKKNWHKYRHHDCEVSLLLTVLPPPN